MIQLSIAISLRSNCIDPKLEKQIRGTDFIAIGTQVEIRRPWETVESEWELGMWVSFRIFFVP